MHWQSWHSRKVWQNDNTVVNDYSGTCGIACRGECTLGDTAIGRYRLAIGVSGTSGVRADLVTRAHIVV